MNQSLSLFSTMDEKLHEIVESLKLKMNPFGYADIHYRIEELMFNEGAIDVFGISFSNEQGEKITPGFFCSPDCFEFPYDTVERFSDLVISLVFQEVGIRLQQEVIYYLRLNNTLVKPEALTESEKLEADLPSHFFLKDHCFEGLYGCCDGLWLVLDGAWKKVTLFDVCIPDDTNET